MESVQVVGLIKACFEPVKSLQLGIQYRVEMKML